MHGEKYCYQHVNSVTDVQNIKIKLLPQQMTNETWIKCLTDGDIAQIRERPEIQYSDFYV